MNNHTETDAPVDGREEIEIERADQRLIEAREEAALVRGEAAPAVVEERIHRMSRRSFLWGALAVGATVGGVKWIGSRRAEDGVPWPLRRGLQNNEAFWRDVSAQSKLSPTYPRARAREIRVNGGEGMSDDFKLLDWRMNIEGLDGAPASVTLADIKKLPHVEMTTELKCIEGWATVVNWGGVRLSDWVAQYVAKPQDLPDYVGFTTPDGGYYVGLEMAAAAAPANPVVLRNERQTAGARTRRAAALGDADQIWHQKSEAHRHAELHQPAPRRLLGAARLRLLRGVLDSRARSKDMARHVPASHTIHLFSASREHFVNSNG